MTLIALTSIGPAIKDGAILLRTLSNDPSLGLSLRLEKLMPWMCYVVWRVVETPIPNTEVGEQCRMLAFLTTFVSIHVGLAQGPDWIAQSLKRTHFPLRSLWKFSQEDLTAELAKNHCGDPQYAYHQFHMANRFATGSDIVKEARVRR